MAECLTDGCGNEAIFSTICMFCSIGKGPSEAEIARYKPRAVMPFVTWAGNTEDFFDDQQKKKALTIAGSPSRGDGSLTDAKGMRLHHVTVPRVNFSIWYIRNVSAINITVYGLGRHIGKDNKKYDVQWWDGSSSTVKL